MGLFTHAVKTPYLTVLVTTVGLSVAAGVALLGKHLSVDPTLVVRNKQENPYPWLLVPQNTNLKLYAVNNKFEERGVRKTALKTLATEKSEYDLDI